ncbi:hypothetical protein IRZ71_07550 [Flavobacterium sp. ANB]|uniref:hypothetical protein n=1 Tax=unclassified Flavobacterium TaxID=196869 RepID=UPI0012B996DD|nr:MULTISPECIES: hypothetical protein [unclassified Flavobacterium]MBF4516190.1 hypothetical protein [Flavobacterium sp. ANB]MTD69913.1 hypothetical protein [Flavobacterium sp. LC2016-13]
MKHLILSLLVLILFSCKKNEEKSASKMLNKKAQDTLKTETENDDFEKQDTLKINYLEHKNLLDILTILPDSTMESWEWEKLERVEYVKKIQKNNYAMPPRDRYSTISLIQPNTLQIGVVDGSWILSIYKIKPNNYIVITDDKVGDGNEFMAFEYLNGELTYIPFKDIFDHFLTTLMIDENDEKCMEFFKDNYIGFEYEFIGTKKLHITNFSLEESKSCFKGNTLNYEFNPEAKKFNLINIEYLKR